MCTTLAHYVDGGVSNVDIDGNNTYRSKLSESPSPTFETLPYGHSEGLFGLVVLLTGFRHLITAFHEVRRLLKRGFEHAEQLAVCPHQSTVRIAALVVVENRSW